MTAMAEAIPNPIRQLEDQFEGLLMSARGDATATASARMRDATPEELGVLAHASVAKPHD